jgi:ceramide glucosyltransferase
VIYLAAPAVVAAIYQLIALLAGVRRIRATDRQECLSYPPISILKPVHGRDPYFYDAIRSHALIDYPEFEILFGARDPNDPALEDVARLAADFPGRAIRVFQCSRNMPNGKVAVLAELAREARHPVVVVNDSDIAVERDYLRKVTAELADPRVGLVTCLYRASGAGLPARGEALGIATDFIPSVLVARAIGVAEFALGSTMALRAETLREIGGFEAIGDYLADDYQLGRRVSALGGRIALAGTVVETHLAGKTWGDVWRHQLRWARTIRVSRAGGYYGYAITNASVWAALAVAAGAWRVAVVALGLRLAAGIVTGTMLLGDRNAARYWFLIPFRDLWGFAVWLAGLAGSTVEWRGERLTLGADGRIVRNHPET